MPAIPVITHSRVARDIEQCRRPADLKLEGVGKSYPTGAGRLTVLAGVDLAIRRPEVVALVGRSGSGKSTVLHVAAGLDTVDAGRVVIGGTDLALLGMEERAVLR